MERVSDFRARVVRQYPDDSRLMLMRDRRVDGRMMVDVVTGFQTETLEEGFIYTEDVGLSFANGLIQKIVDEAWEAGVRPTGYSDVKNETAAIHSHLQDMRAITFHKLGMKEG